MVRRNILVYVPILGIELPATTDATLHGSTHCPASSQGDAATRFTIQKAWVGGVECTRRRQTKLLFRSQSQPTTNITALA